MDWAPTSEGTTPDKQQVQTAQDSAIGTFPVTKTEQQAPQPEQQTPQPEQQLAASGAWQSSANFEQLISTIVQQHTQGFVKRPEFDNLFLDVQDLKEKNCTLVNQVLQLKTKLEAKENEIADLNIRIYAFKRTIFQQTESLHFKDDEINRLKAEVATMKETKERTKLQEQLIELTGQRAEDEMILAVMQRENDSLLHELEKVKLENEQLKKEKLKLLEDLQNAKLEISKTKNELELANKTAQTSNGQCRDLESKLAVSHDMIAHLTTQMENMRSIYEIGKEIVRKYRSSPENAEENFELLDKHILELLSQNL